jgi:hypothetical protein
LQPVHSLIASEYARCALISYISQPSDRTLPGWGAPGKIPRASYQFAHFQAGSNMQGVRFRTAMLDTVKVIGMPSRFARSQLTLRRQTLRRRAFAGTCDFSSSLFLSLSFSFTAPLSHLFRLGRPALATRLATSLPRVRSGNRARQVPTRRADRGRLLGLLSLHAGYCQRGHESFA